MIKKLLTTLTALSFAACASAEIVAFSDDGTGARFNLHNDTCLQFGGADGIATFTQEGADRQFEGCWKYDKENNVVLIVIEGRVFELPATMFTST
tara:strand:+ start:4167 stop:4451 length:285 start_codon:yes stop_codon:yes gene_type:complete